MATDVKFLGHKPGLKLIGILQMRDNESREDMKNIDYKHGIWRCHFDVFWSNVLPKGVDPALGIQLLRRHLTSFSKHDKKIAEMKHNGQVTQ